MFNFLLTIAIATISAFAPWASQPHKFYVSVIEIRHAEADQQGQIKLRIFSDDLQIGIQSEFNLENPPPTETLCDDEQQMLDNFIDHHVFLKVNGRDQMPVQYECDSDADVHEIVWALPESSAWKRLEIKADYLMDIYPDQVQMVHISEGEQKRTMRLTRKSPSGIIEFQN